VVVNGHGGNLDALSATIGEWNYENPMKVFLLWPFECIEIKDEWHAGYAESSIVSYLLKAQFKGKGNLCDFIFPYFRTYECSKTGSLYKGEFSSNPELGQKLMDEMIRCSFEKVKDFLAHLEASQEP